ncbi:zinc-ribbon domain-containing protein [[Eubacterium] cellulosolvens]
MNSCVDCGAQIAEAADFCSKCGAQKIAESISPGTYRSRS